MTNTQRILVVDDDPNDRLLIQRALKRAGLDKFSDFVADGQEALDFLKRASLSPTGASSLPGAVMLDLKMPRLGGLQVLERIRSTPDLHLLPVVVLTSSKEPRDVDTAYRLGANAFVVKPSGFDEFLDVVERLGVFWARTNEPPAA